MEANVFIRGQIGSGLDNKGNLVKGVELIDVISQVKSIEGKDVVVAINSPGGFVDVGDAIYNYLESLKAQGYTVTTKAESIVGSIASKVYLAGDVREVSEGSKIFIHNPSANPGQSDASKLTAFAIKVSAIEDSLRKFYASKTKASEEELKPLMDVETTITADQAVALGFANQKNEEVKILAKINMGLIDDVLKGAKALMGVKAMVDLPLSDGATIVQVEAEPGEDLKGKPAKVNGQPAPAGEHTLADGKVLVVGADGMVVEVKEAPAPAPVEDKKYEEMKANMEKLAQAVQSLVQAQASATQNFTKALDERVTALKSEIKTGHRPATKSVDAVRNEMSPADAYLKK